MPIYCLSGRISESHVVTAVSDMGLFRTIVRKLHCTPLLPHSAKHQQRAWLLIWPPIG